MFHENLFSLDLIDTALESVTANTLLGGPNDFNFFDETPANDSAQVDALSEEEALMFSKILEHDDDDDDNATGLDCATALDCEHTDSVFGDSLFPCALGVAHDDTDDKSLFDNPEISHTNLDGFAVGFPKSLPLQIKHTKKGKEALFVLPAAPPPSPVITVANEGQVDWSKCNFLYRTKHCLLNQQFMNEQGPKMSCTQRIIRYTIA